MFSLSFFFFQFFFWSLKHDYWKLCIIWLSYKTVLECTISGPQEALEGKQLGDVNGFFHTHHIRIHTACLTVKKNEG